MTTTNPSWPKGVQVGIPKIIATLVIAAAALLGSGGSANAAYCGASSNGCDQAFGNTICAGHGAFGAFGDKGDFGHDWRGGADGAATGAANSNLCGNPQGVPGQ
jgi:hypothetical protein